MKTLSATLLAAQQSAIFQPYIKVEARRRLDGATRLDFTRLYSGDERELPHAAAMAGDGSLIRARLDAYNQLWHQRTPNPSEASDYSQWTDSGIGNVTALAAAAHGAEVCIFFINTSRQVRYIKSSDNGLNWGASASIENAVSSATTGLSACYKASGDIGLFFTDNITLYAVKRTGGIWCGKAGWGETTGALSGVAAYYDEDWGLMVCGVAADGDYKLWSLAYGDGGAIGAGEWSVLNVVDSAPADGLYRYKSCFMDKADAVRCYYVEQFIGHGHEEELYTRIYQTHLAGGAAVNDNRWHEPVPYNQTSEYGLALTHDANYCWLSAPYGVWRAPLNEQMLDLSADVMALKQDNGAFGGKLTVELGNGTGAYNALPEPLGIGCEITLCVGYRTAFGDETGAGQTYKLDGYEYSSSTDGARLVLYASDGWERLSRWRARQQFQWNHVGTERSVGSILAFILARVGINLESVSEDYEHHEHISPHMADAYPHFIINPANRGDSVVRTLLSFVCDSVFLEGDKAFLASPRTDDATLYSYGGAHAVRSARYGRRAADANHVAVIGQQADAAGGGRYTYTPIEIDSFNWDEIALYGDNLLYVDDTNLGSAATVADRGADLLVGLRLGTAGGHIQVAPNCGQQLYDVISVTDARLALAGYRCRVMGLSLTYDRMKAVYEQTLTLGGV